MSFASAFFLLSFSSTNSRHHNHIVWVNRPIISGTFVLMAAGIELCRLLWPIRGFRWNLTNPADVLAGGDPKMARVGPYTFEERMLKHSFR